MSRQWHTFYPRCCQHFCWRMQVCTCWLSLVRRFFLLESSISLNIFKGQDDEESKKFIGIASGFHVPGLISILLDVDKPDEVIRKSVSQFKKIRNLPAAYCCHNRQCTLPITDPKLLAEEFAAKYLFADAEKK